MLVAWLVIATTPNLSIDQSDTSFTNPKPQGPTSRDQIKEIEDITCCVDKSKRMSVCSNEVCALSDKKSAIKSMALVQEDVGRASPIPFSKGEISSEEFKAASQGTLKLSENVQTLEEDNIHITRKTKVQESLVKSQKMYAAEVTTSSSVHHRPGTPEIEQIMETRREFPTYHDTNRMTPNTVSLLQKQQQSERCLTPEIENLMDKPHGSWSPMPPACMVRPISPSQIISFPPDIPPIPATMPHPRTATPEQFQEARQTVERFVDNTKHHEEQLNTSRTSSQFHSQQAAFSVYSQESSGQQYTPRYDATQGFSAYKGSSGGRNLNNGNGGTSYQNNSGNGNPGNHGNGNPGNHRESGSHANGNPGNHRASNPSNNGNPNNGNTGKGRPEEKREDNPKVTEPDDSDDKYHQTSSGADQSGPSRNEEESTRRIFSDFGGPQISSSVQVESVTEDNVEKTSVTKSEQMQYSTCEFQSSHKSSIIQGGESTDFSSNSSRGQNTSTSAESKKQSYPKFTPSEASTSEEEKITKSQVEQIIKQELNKVFNMAETMEKTNFGQMHEQKSQQASDKSYRTSSDQHVIKSVAASSSESQKQSVSNVEQSGTEVFNMKCTSSHQQDTTPFTGQPIRTPGKLTSGLTIAPGRPFTPQPLESNFPLPYQNMPSNAPTPRSINPDPTPVIPGYIPLTGDRDSPLLQALTIAPERSYSPLPTATVVETPPFISAPKPQRSTMLDALTTAPSTPFQIKSMSSEATIEESDFLQRTMHESVQNYCSKQIQSGYKATSSESVKKTLCPKSVCPAQKPDTCTKSFPPVSNELQSTYKGSSQVQSSPFVESELSRQSTKTSHQRSLSASRAERAVTPSGLHAPNFLPYYQQNIGEIPLAHRSSSPIPHQIKAPSINPPRAQSVPRQGERRCSVKAMGEAYLQQVASLNSHQQASTSSSSYASTDIYGSGAVTKTYSYEQEHKPIDTMGYHPSPLVGKVPLAGEQILPKCSSPLLGKLDHTKQVFKPSIPEQANLKQAPPYFVQEKEKAAQTPWVVVKGKEERDTMKASLISSLKTQAKHSISSIPLPKIPTLPTLPNVNKIPAFPEPPKPGVTTTPDAGPGGAPKGGATAGTSAPRRGRGVLNAAVGVGGRVPLCASCNNQIRGPFITALGKIWCPEHFVCVNAQCRRHLQDIGFVEDAQGLYCEFCFEQYLAPTCNKCNAKVKGDCLNAIGKHFHPECFTCAYCGKLFGNSPFFLEDALPYCEADWNELFTTKCFSCGFPIEAGDRWVEALNNNYHSQCFNCTMCKKNLEGQSFFAKGGRPFCKNHAR